MPEKEEQEMSNRTGGRGEDGAEEHILLLQKNIRLFLIPETACKVFAHSITLSIPSRDFQNSCCAWYIFYLLHLFMTSLIQTGK